MPSALVALRLLFRIQRDATRLQTCHVLGMYNAGACRPRTSGSGTAQRAGAERPDFIWDGSVVAGGCEPSSRRLSRF